MKRMVSIFAAMVVVAAMVAAMAMPAFASHKKDNRINTAGNRNQVAVINSSQTLNQNVTQNSTQTASIGSNCGGALLANCPASGSIVQNSNSSTSTSQKQTNVTFQARNSFNR